MAKQILLTDNGVHREAKDGYITVNGVYRKIKEGYVTVNGVYRQFMSGGLALADLPVGVLIRTNVNGAAKNFIVVHQGNPSTSLYDSSCDGTWLLMQDIYNTQRWHSSQNNSYKASTIHSYLNNTLLGLFDGGIQSLIKQVKIPYKNGTGTSGSVASGSNGLSAKMFLLSAHEVCCGSAAANSFGFPTDGVCLDYFSGSEGTNSIRIAYYDDKATNWWLRTPSGVNALNVAVVYAHGGVGSLSSTRTYGVRPAFILPSDAMVNPTPNADGSYTLLA